MNNLIEIETKSKNNDFLKGLLFFLISGVILTISGYINGKYVLGNSDYYTIIFPQLSDEQISEINTPLWLCCIAPIVTNLLYIFVISLVVYIGFFLTTKQKYATIFKNVAIADVVFATMYLVNYSNIGFNRLPQCIGEISTFPLSLASFFDVCRLDMWMVIPLSYFNIFEIFFVLLLSYLLSKNFKNSFSKSLKMVLYTYGLTLVLIIICLCSSYIFMTE